MPEVSARVKAQRQTTEFRAPVDLPADPPPGGAPVGGIPNIPGIQWEFKEHRMVVEAWFAPVGGRNRAGKQYIGRFGKRRMAELYQASDTDRSALIREQVNQWKREKGID